MQFGTPDYKHTHFFPVQRKEKYLRVCRLAVQGAEAVTAQCIFSECYSHLFSFFLPQTLCLALETTYPHLLTIMLIGASQRSPSYASRQSE